MFLLVIMHYRTHWLVVYRRPDSVQLTEGRSPPPQLSCSGEGMLLSINNVIEYKGGPRVVPLIAFDGIVIDVFRHRRYHQRAHL